jgi:hypothetical protein
MLIVGAVLENIQTSRPSEAETVRLLRHLQKELRYGIPSGFPVGIYELGFADRALSQELSDLFGNANDARGIRRQPITNADEIRARLMNYPSYFSAVYDGLVRPSDR